MTDYFAILILESNCERNIKEVFALNCGENTIGSDNDCDIVIQLCDDSIEPLHAKIIVNEEYNDIGLEDISTSNSIYKEINNRKVKLKKKREYELFPMRQFYLTLTLKMYIYKGNKKEIERFLEEKELSYYKDYINKKIENFLQEEKIKRGYLDASDENKENKNHLSQKRVIDDDDFNCILDEYNSKGNINNLNLNEKGKKEETIKMKMEHNLRAEEQKIIQDILELPKDIKEILPLEENEENEIMFSNSNSKEELSQLLSERLRRKKIEVSENEKKNNKHPYILTNKINKIN